MRFFFLCLLSLLTLYGDPKPTNALIYESSLYLQQHAHNPIAWYPYRPDVLQKAKQEHKLIFLSIGYSTCHWCHVMAEESFENLEIAKVLNENYIAIKVDREELPHIDSYYQQLFTKLHHRSGGWPLSVILDENAKPFFLGGYIPFKDAYGLEGLSKLLPRLANVYKKAPEEIAAEVKHLQKLQKEDVYSKVADKRKITEQQIMASFLEDYDDLYYGFSKQPKFPEPARIQLLFDLYDLGHEKAGEMALQVLRMMALHGIYDQVEGGFFRYSTDAGWEIPHFEKMLYTQAELILLYVRAYEESQDKLFLSVVEETIAMVLERFSDGGLFYSASNADSGGEEGGYFIFSEREIEEALDASGEKEVLNEAMAYDGFMNFDAHLHINFYSAHRPKGLKAFRSTLKKIRQKRHYPFVDKKHITAWNAMMIEALYAAGRINTSYIKLADERVKILKRKMWRNNLLYHQSAEKKAPKQEALLEDYAFLIAALIAAYETHYDRHYLAFASQLMDQAIFRFYRQGVWLQADDSLEVQVELKDKYYTSSFGKSMQDLLRLAVLEENLAYQKIARDSLSYKSAEILSKRSRVPSSTRALLMLQKGLIALKHTKERLLKNSGELRSLKYPYLLTKAVPEAKAFLACSVDRCFAYDTNLSSLLQKIDTTYILK